jgi:hypothetical protein
MGEYLGPAAADSASGQDGIQPAVSEYGGHHSDGGDPGGRSRKSLWLALSGGVLAVGLIAVIGFLALPDGRKPCAAAPSANTSAPSYADCGVVHGTAGSASSAPGQPGRFGGLALTGSQLKAELPGSGELPNGWTVSPGSEADSGATLATPEPSSAAFTHSTCSELVTVDAYEVLSAYAASYAHENADIPRAGADIDVAGYYPGDAARALAEIRNRVGSCRQFRARDANGHTGTFTVTLAPAVVGGADDAVTIQVSSATFAGSYVLVARFGNTAFGISEVGYESGNSADTRQFPRIAAGIGHKIRGQ